MILKLRSVARNKLASVTSIGILLCLTLPTTDAHSQSSTASTAAASAVQQSFDTPQQAADAVIKAASDYDVATLLKIFGSDGEDFFTSPDQVQDKSYATAFAAKAREKNVVSIDPKDPSRAMLVVGNED